MSRRARQVDRLLALLRLIAWRHYRVGHEAWTDELSQCQQETVKAEKAAEVRTWRGRIYESHSPTSWSE